MKQLLFSFYDGFSPAVLGPHNPRRFSYAKAREGSRRLSCVLSVPDGKPDSHARPCHPYDKRTPSGVFLTDPVSESILFPLT